MNRYTEWSTESRGITRSARVKIIKNPFNEKDELNLKVRNNTCVKDIKGFDPEKSVAYVNGKHVNSDYILKRGDVCVIRQYPQEILTATLTVGALLKGLAIGAGILLGAEVVSYAVSGRGLFANIGIGLRKWLTGDSDDVSNKEEITQLPSVSGSKNQSASGKAIPLILGKTYFAPYYLGKPYNTIEGEDGEDDFYHALYLIGYHNLKIEDVSIGLETLATNQEGVENGALTITSEKYPAHDPEHPDPRDHYTQLELRQSGEVSLYPCKVVQENFNIELLNANGDGTYYYGFSARYPKKVEVELTFNGLLGYDDKGHKIDAETKVTLERSFDGGQTWENCSSSIDLSHATGSSQYVEVASDAYATIAWNITYDPSPYSTGYTFNSLSMNISQGSVTDPLELQFHNGSAWVTLLMIPSGGTGSSTSGRTINSISRFRLKSGKWSSGEFAMSTGCSSTQKDLPEQSHGSYVLFKNQKPKTLRYVFRQEFTYTQIHSCDAHVVQYRIYRLNAKATDSNIVDSVYFTAIRTWCYDNSKSNANDGLIDQIPMNEKERDKTARLGFSIKISADLQNQFDKINLIATSKARTYDGTGWSNTLSPTRNPASLALMVMTGDYRDKRYRYDLGNDTYAKSEKIDLDSFGTLYQLCDQTRTFGNGYSDKRYYCDGVVLNSTKSIDLINSILECARSNLIINGKKYGIFTDKAQEYPLVNLNNNNLLGLAYSKNFDEIPDGQSVKYVSALNYYQQDTMVVKPDGTSQATSDDVLETVEYPFISDPYHAKSMSLYKQACKRLRPESMMATVTGEGGLAEIGSLISIQSDKVLIGIGDGAEITEVVSSNGEIIGIKTDGRFEADVDTDYGVVINVVDTYGQEKTLKKKLTRFARAGTYSELTFDTPITVEPFPEEGYIVSFGLYQSEALEMLCVGKNEKGDGTYELTIVPYSPEIYDADSLIVHDFDPKTTPPSQSNLPMSNGDLSVPVTQAELLESVNSAVVKIEEGADVNPTDPDNFTVVAYENYIELKCVQEGDTLKDCIKYYEFEITKGSGSPFVIQSGSNNFDYVFKRDVDGYPEAEELSDWTFRVRVTNIYDNHSEWVEHNIDLSHYGTWQIPQIRVDTEVTDRTVILTAVYGGSSNVYGKTKTCVKVKRLGNTDVIDGMSANEMLTVTPDEVFYKPKFDALVQTQSDADNEPNYREESDTTPFESVSNKITHTLPLIGQTYRIFKDGNVPVTYEDEEEVVHPLFTKDVADSSEVPAEPSEGDVIHYTGEGETVGQTMFYKGGYYLYENAEWMQVHSKALIVPTTYQYEIYMTNESGNVSNSCTVTVVAQATNIADVVHSHEHYKDLYVEKLSAINANIGLISQGGMGSFEDMTNCWALSDLTADDSGVVGGVMKGTFRVGDENEYFRVTPYLDPNDSTKRKYKIELKAGNIELSTDVEGDSAMDFTNGTYVYNADKSVRLMLAPSGIIAQKRTGTAPNYVWEDVSKVFADEKGNMIISNADADKIPTFGYQANGDVYHFDDPLHPENEEVGESETPSNPQQISGTGSCMPIDNTDPIILRESSKYCFNGNLTKDVSNFVGTIVMLSKADRVKVSNDTFIKVNGVANYSKAKEYNDYMSEIKEASTMGEEDSTVGEYLGLTTTQISSRIFTEV